MSITNASSTQKLVTNAWIAFTGTAPSAANYAAHVAFVGTSGAAAYISFLSSHAKTIPAATLASNLLTNLGLSSVFTAAEALAYINSNLNNLGEAITRVSEATLNYVSDSTFSKNAEMLAAKAAYTATATTALTHSSNSANTSSAQAVTPAPSAPVGPAAPDGATIMLTISATDTQTGTSLDDFFGGEISSTSSKNTYQAGDSITDGSVTDNDRFTLTTDNDVAAGPTIRNIETINVNLNAVTTAAATGDTLDFSATNISGAKTFNFDVTAPISAVSKLTVTGITDSATFNATSDFNVIDLTAAAGKSLTINSSAVGTAGSPILVTTGGNTTGNVTVTGAGHLTVAPTNTALVNATASNSLTFTAAAATSTVLIGNAIKGNLTVADGGAALIMDLKASGDISISETGAGSVKAVAGGTISLIGGAAALLTSGEFSAVGNSSIDGNDLSSMVISGNGAAVTFTMATGNHEDLTDVVVRGANNVTLKVESAEIKGALNVVDETTAGIVTVEISGTAEIVNTSSNVIDVLKVTGNAAGQFTVADKQEVTYTVDQTAALVAVGKAASAASQSVTIKLDDGNKTTGAVDLTAITITTAKTVLIDASIDTTAAGGANASSVGGIIASGANSNVTIATGVNGLTLAGTNTVGTGTLKITGSGPIALGASTLTASAFDASEVSGAVTGTTFNPTNVRSISTGSGDDTLTLANIAAADLTLSTGKGNDVITIAGVTTADKATVIDLGEGNDTLKFQNGTILVKGTTGSVSLVGVETIEFNSTSTTQQIQAELLNGQTTAIKASATGAANSVAVVVGPTDTTVDLSLLAGSLAAGSTIAGMTFVTNAKVNTASIAITGIKAAANTITGSDSAGDVLTGGDVADTFVILSDALLFDADGVMLDTISGGASAANTRDNLLVGTTATAFTIAGTDTWSKLSGVESITSIEQTGIISITLGKSAETAGLTHVDLSGDTSNTGANVINVSAFTEQGATLIGSAGVDTITGGAGADTITGGAGADVLSGGDGNDVFVYAATADLFSTNAVVDSINGGAGTDTIRVGVTTGATTFAIATTDVWTRASSVEVIKSVADSGAHTIDFHASAYTAGIRTVDLSAALKTTDNIIDASEITGGGMTLTGSATGVTTITGGSGADTIKGGAAADILDGGAGIDTYMFAASAALNGADRIVWDADNASDIFNFSAFFGSGVGSAIDVNGVGTAGLGSFTTASNSDTNIANKVAVFLSEADADAEDNALTIAELFAEINGAGNAFALTEGKAIVVAIGHDTDAAEAAPTVLYTAFIYSIDTALDGAAGLSVNDIVLIGTFSAANGDPVATEIVFADANFGFTA